MSHTHSCHRASLHFIASRSHVGRRANRPPLPLPEPEWHRLARRRSHLTVEQVACQVAACDGRRELLTYSGHRERLQQAVGHRHPDPLQLVAVVGAAVVEHAAKPDFSRRAGVVETVADHQAVGGR